jgi:endonuclease/exonuclease/phosphatase family metal-dependent hydrolase
MQRLLILLIVPFLLSAKPFSVATYNVENLFDAVYNGTEYKEYIPGKYGWNRRMAEKKLDHTAEVICDLDVDILGLQEVENEAVFLALQKRLKRVGCGYRYGAITHKEGSPIQVALLSRFPIEKSRDLQVSYAARVRNILEVKVRVEGTPLILFINHWKSKSRKGYESKRLAYARTLATRITTIPKGVSYLILGDLNSNYDAYQTLPKRLNDTKGKTGINHLLHTVISKGFVTEKEMQNGPFGIHYDLWLELPFRERWSHKFYGRKSTLDHILLPVTMFDGKGIDYMNDSFRVFKRRYLFTKKGYINSWQFKNGKHAGRGYSDHLPLVARFDTVPYVASANSMVQKSITGRIEDLYKLKKVEQPIRLNDVVVVLKRGRYAVLKQSSSGRGIFVYGAVYGLEEGKRYDLRVEEISDYQGLKEITALSKLKEKGEVPLSPFYASMKILRQNEVLHGLKGVYRNGYFHTSGIKIPLYFKNRKYIPKNGEKLKIAYAHLGYYKKLQLVVYSRKDFRILEK